MHVLTVTHVLFKNKGICKVVFVMVKLYRKKKKEM